uniref:Uncharacterized protein n=1 Tax=Amphimedon queenslandica TaxID=400682 RepID=A0A1X7UCS0_AMPQE
FVIINSICFQQIKIYKNVSKLCISYNTWIFSKKKLANLKFH